MSDDPHALDLNATLNRMEPGLSTPSVEQSLASIAISLKRIADHNEFTTQPVNRHDLMEASYGIQSAINGHSTKVVMAK